MDDQNLLLLATKFRKLRDKVELLSVKQEEIQIKEGQQGPKGEQGDRGFDGAPGKDGADGQDGRDGQDGKDGVSVVNAEISFDGSLVIYLSDGREVDCGYVVKETSDKVLQTLKQGSSARLEDIQNILLTSPVNGDILTYESSSGLWKNKQPSPKITVSATAPTSPSTGDIWFDIS